MWRCPSQRDPLYLDDNSLPGWTTSSDQSRWRGSYSYAFRTRNKTTGLIEDPSLGVSGPLWVRGGIPVTGADGGQYEVRKRVTLCRCGQSKNKPFCDGSHIEAGFKDFE